MNDHAAKHYLKPGRMFFATKPTIITTILGSCVSVTMFHPNRRIGAICHGLLPVCSESKTCRCRKACENGFKNIQCSIKIMFEKFNEIGILPHELDVKVFGGSEMFDNRSNESDKLSVGSQNVAIALKLLEEAGVRIKSSDLGGMRGRKLHFNSFTGEVLLKRMRSRSPAHVCC